MASIGSVITLDCPRCKGRWKRFQHTVENGRIPKYCPAHRKKRNVAGRVTVWQCQGCGLEFERVAPSDGGRPRVWCDECRPLQTRRTRLAYYYRTESPAAKSSSTARIKRRLRDKARSDPRMLNTLRGYTPEEWVARWNERPDLFLALIKAMERNAFKYPGHPKQYRSLWEEAA